VSRYQKSKTNLDFTEARDSEWQWHQLGHKQVSTLLQTDKHASTPPLSFLQAGCPSFRPTNSIKALIASKTRTKHKTDNARRLSVQRTESGFLIRQRSWRRPGSDSVVSQSQLHGQRSSGSHSTTSLTMSSPASRAVRRRILLDDDKLLVGYVAKQMPRLSHKFD